MKRKDVIKHLSSDNCILKREGGSHSVYFNLTNRKTSTLPRHNEINDFLVKKICKNLEINSPSELKVKDILITSTATKRLRLINIGNVWEAHLEREDTKDFIAASLLLNVECRRVL